MQGDNENNDKEICEGVPGRYLYRSAQSTIIKFHLTLSFK